MKPHSILFLSALGFAACELALGLDDKTFCDDAPEQCHPGQTVSTSSVGGSAVSSSSAGGNGGDGSGGEGCDDYEFSVEWDAGDLASWQTLDDLDDDISDPMSTLDIEPDEDDYWWDNEQAPFVYREVCGDFGVRIHITTLEPVNSLNPSEQWNGGGILVRNPEPPAGALNEHWLLLSHGFETEGMGAAGYWSGPNDGGNFILPEAMYSSPVLPGGQLALCRVDGMWHGYFMPDCGSPEILFGEAVELVNLPDRVQVGVTVHRRGAERIKGTFRWTDLFRPQDPQDCFDALDTSYVPDGGCPS